MEFCRPDIVIGIDVGQTCSGVSYSIGPDWPEPRNLNRWPSSHGFEKADKVATRVGYSRKSKQLNKWGFQCVFGDENFDVHEHFKLALDEEYEDGRGFDSEQARQWYCDYLKCLHREIGRSFDTIIPKWRMFRIEYNFSTPTTWRNPAMIASIEGLIKAAGFASTENQTVRMSLTEAEAAAIEVSTYYLPGDIFLICDAGGGTTDVNLLRVKSVNPTIELEPLDQVEGEPIGSTLIDFRMLEHLVSRLRIIERHLHGNLDLLADEMLAGRFQTVKHSFPSPMKNDEFWLDVKGLPGLQTFPEAGIKDSKISISRTTLEDIFDQQFTKIFALIDDRLHNLEKTHPGEPVSYIILSGGLGSSPYLLEETQKRYEQNCGFRSSNTASTRVMTVHEPQLAVVRGLVRERTQQLGRSSVEGQEVFNTRRCRNSYGVVVRSLYNEAKHKGLTTVKDGDRVWVEGAIDWMIKKGEEVSVSEGIKRHYSATIPLANHRLPRKARVVMSPLPADKLPLQEKENTCCEVAAVSYHLTPNDMKLKNRQFWKLKKKYWKAEFIFVVNPGPADLKFQVIGKNGVLSSDNDSLEVDYMEPSDLRHQRLRPGWNNSMPALLEVAGDGSSGASL